VVAIEAISVILNATTSSLRAKPDTTIGAASDRNGLDLDLQI
jgi:hypothetical protein